MRRREFISFVGSAVAAWASAAVAQAPRLWKIGVLANESWPPLEGLRHGLQDLGYVEGKDSSLPVPFCRRDARSDFLPWRPNW